MTIEPDPAQPARESGRLRRALGRPLGAVADFIVPPGCLACGRALAVHDAICAACWRDVSFIRPPLCDVLGIPLAFATGEVTVSAAAIADPPPYDRARAVAHFTGTMRRLVHHLKFHDRHDGRRLLGRWLAEAGRDLLPGCDLIVPVPLARWWLFTRRFNQAALLSRELSRLTGIVVDPVTLQRRRNTPSQVGLTEDQRRRNVAGAFAVDARRTAAIAGRHVLLIDDVVTTGATVSACARVLRRAGAARVDVLALALVSDTILVAP